MKQYLEDNPVIFYDHSWMFGAGDMKLPVGKALTLAVDSKGIHSTFRFSSLAEKDGEFANKVKALVDDGILNSFSIGYMPKENVYNPEEIARIMAENAIPTEQLPHLITTKWEILEYSIVGIPSNRESIMTNLAPEQAVKMKSFLDDFEKLTMKRKEIGNNSPVKQPLSIAEKLKIGMGK